MTSVAITVGFPEAAPWVINNVDKSLENLAVAKLASLGEKQEILLKTQIGVLNQQAKNIEDLQRGFGELDFSVFGKFVQDATGKVLISNPDVVSDLVGKTFDQIAAGEPEDISRLIQFSSNLANNVSPVNLSAQIFVSALFSDGGPIRTGTFPVEVVTSFPDASNAQLYVCYYNKNTDTYRIFARGLDGNVAVNQFPPTTPLPLQTPAKEFAYDAYRITYQVDGQTFTKILRPQSYSGTNPPNTGSITLYRDVSNGTLVLKGVEGNNKTEINTAEGFVIPESDAEVRFWLGQAIWPRVSAMFAAFVKDEIKFTPDTVQWKDTKFNVTGFAPYPVRDLTGQPINIATGEFLVNPALVPGTLIKRQDKYFRVDSVTVSSSSGGIPASYRGSFSEVTLLDPPFKLKMTSDDVKDIRSQYSEKLVQATQRSSEQQLFVNSLIVKRNYYYDAVSNVLKSFFDLRSRMYPNSR